MFTPTDQIKHKLDKLMSNPDKPVEIPAKREKKPYEGPDFVRNIMGSSAGAGSGEFHVYRHLRRKEYARQKSMEIEARHESLDEQYHRKLQENRRLAEERTNKKRQKRLKKKGKLKRKKTEDKSKSNAIDAANKDEEEESDESESDRSSTHDKMLAEDKLKLSNKSDNENAPRQEDVTVESQKNSD